MRDQGRHYYSRVTARGQITLPAALRQRLGVAPGDLVELAAVPGEERIEVRRRKSLIEETARHRTAQDAVSEARMGRGRGIGEGGVALRLHEEMSLNSH